ncbi:hypothetical protein SAXI111661_20210 [Saccharomonospora xinjiangensis]|uniref:hypothetical protein n=1 Tax=Saccharomonospora xinjiangensis TaxID=75294 RepID=UPI00106FF194|nr:hypothetical protein [Saccharomonospora xinjiangensis]QBQ60934.1 hypothetical protein EYD13_12905 [Saccharomonospora xinjiangensis]
MRDFHENGVRGAGPAVVWQGPEGAPVVLVLDPAGEAKHETLPATWRPLAEHLHIGWCRLPAEVGDAPSVEDVLAGVSERVHLVAAATAAEAALRLAGEHTGQVRSVVVVDPAPVRGAVPADPDGSFRTWWDSGTAEERQRLRARGVRVAAFVTRATDPAVRVEPPVPLGHPDVVGRVVQLLLSFQGDRADPEPVEPERAEVIRAWHAVRERFGPALDRARRSGG